MKVAIIDYGAGNIFSVEQAFKRLGVETVLSKDENEIRSASHVVFPGVGHARSAMEELRKSGLDKVIPTLKQPVLGICLGMQLMCGWNEEGDLNGLGIFRVEIREFRRNSDLTLVEVGFQLPHMGWNDVQFGTISEPFYFVHSYAAGICEDTWGITEYPNPFSSALQKDNFLGVQFHPEKSGVAGEEFLKNFLGVKNEAN